MFSPKTNRLFKIFLCFFPFHVHAKTIETKGHMFKIEEENILSYIQKKLSSSWSEQNYQSTLQKIFVKAKTPESVSFLKEAMRKRTFYFDPTYVVQEDIKTPQGRVLIQKGYSYNPLEKTKLASSLLFLDGTNEKHIAWAKAQKEFCKWILIKGNPFDLEDKEKRPIYFDQGGVISRKFQLKNVPAKISQDGLVLKIEEFPVSEEIIHE